jgi:hypothetical protein
MWKNETAVLVVMLQSEGWRLAKKHSISFSKFKVRVRNFITRHDVTKQCQTMTAHRLPEVYYKYNDSHFPEKCHGK